MGTTTQELHYPRRRCDMGGGMGGGDPSSAAHTVNGSSLRIFRQASVATAAAAVVAAAVVAAAMVEVATVVSVSVVVA